MKTKVKLVAIAKDEAAYLPEWISHHLHVGFDSIDIYVNNTTDNTSDLSLLLASNEKVNFIDGDHFFNSNISKPQEEIYHFAHSEIIGSDFTHMMFLDIDEYWTSKSLDKSIHDCLRVLDADVICFEWFIRQSE
ncbi:glycosyltransferase family 2 protein [Vibrio sp. FNV 38]|nr:glycosyltransferase family 2 protein [Vibrio sp. FNV 38]